MPFCAKNDRVTKTGSGQRHRETSNRDAFSYSVIDAMSSAIEGAAAMLYGVSESYKESANCRCAKRPCFPLKCFVMNQRLFAETGSGQTLTYERNKHVQESGSRGRMEAQYGNARKLGTPFVWSMCAAAAGHSSVSR